MHFDFSSGGIILELILSISSLTLLLQVIPPGLKSIRCKPFKDLTAESYIS